MIEVKVLSHTDRPDWTISHAGRVCYRSDREDNVSHFIKARIKDGHESIIEHASITFEIGGISRACSHQLVRHRLASYSQESQRYVDGEDFEYVIPPGVAASEKATQVFEDLMGQVRDAYKLLRRMGVRKEDARFVLPNAATTRIIVTMNFRELRHFFSVRCNIAAQWEIRKVATEMLIHSYWASPAAFSDLMEKFGLMPRVTP